jgi:pyrroloquinoline-quinone synthase
MMDFQIARLEAAKRSFIDRVTAHSFVTRCRLGMVALDELKLYLVQQGIYGQYFTRYLCAMMANLPSNEAVLTLAENLFEELGLAADRAKPHHLMYRETLQRYELELDESQALPGTRRLIDTMFEHCRSPDPASGLGALCLGAESLVPAIYSDIIAGFEAQGAQPGDLEFFEVHVGCDDGHADALRDIMVEIASRDPARIDRMLLAGQRLVAARLEFFTSIEDAYRHRARDALTMSLGGEPAGAGSEP